MPRLNPLLRPLRWPSERPRTARPRAANFSGDRTLTEAARALLGQLTTRDFARDVVITVADGTATPRRDADPGAAVYFVRLLDAPYFTPGHHAVSVDATGRPRVRQTYCLPCDRWDYAAHNVWALAQHVSALRAMERWGVGTTDDAFSPYVALPPSPDAAPYTPPPAPPPEPTDVGVNRYLRNGGPWRLVLGFHARSRPSFEEVDARYKSLAREHHPDAGGSNTIMVHLNTARDEAYDALVLRRRA